MFCSQILLNTFLRQLSSDHSLQVFVLSKRYMCKKFDIWGNSCSLTSVMHGTLQKVFVIRNQSRTKSLYFQFFKQITMCCTNNCLTFNPFLGAELLCNSLFNYVIRRFQLIFSRPLYISPWKLLQRSNFFNSYIRGQTWPRRLNRKS